MLRVSLLFFIYSGMIFSQELVVIADKNFPEENLTVDEIRAIFLDKQHFIDKQKILVMNHVAQTPLRLCFEEKVLEKGANALERYWRKAYYQGKRPPKVVTSMEMLFLYLDGVTPSIGYSDKNATIGRDVKTIYSVECP